MSKLSKVTSLPVLEILNQTAVQPHQICLAPPNKVAPLIDGTLSFRRAGRTSGCRVDDFMTILAKARGKTPTGVVRSGMGSDGTQRLAPAIPQSAIAGSSASLALPPAGIAPAPGRLGHSAHKPPGRGYATEEFDKIFEILRTATGIDFHDYRRPSIVRRILRQMTLHGVGTLAQYARLLRRDRKEMESLADQVFVPFTGFFRDPESFQALRNRIRRKLQRKQRANTLRVWVAGCSTGEEVYSIAMLLLEELEPSTNTTTIQVFGTDIRASSLQHARDGVYPQTAVADLSPARLERFFVKSEDGYRINTQVRDLCVFALHDLTKQPPFSNLDLISCRNVLPYLKPPLQNQALAAFHFALKPRALLFTDSAIVAKARGQFTVKDRKHGILSRMPDKRKAHGGPRSFALPGRRESVSGVSSTQAALLAANEQLSAAYEELETANKDLGTLLADIDIPMLVLDSHLRILRFTPAAATLFHLKSSDVSLPFVSRASNLGKLPWQDLLPKVTRGGRTIERTFQHQNGRWYSLRMKPFGEKKNAVSGVLLVLLDESTIRRSLDETRDSLAESEATVRMLLEASPQGVLAVDARGTIVWVNDTAGTMFGYEVPELLGQPMEFLVPEPSRGRHSGYHKAFFAAAKSRPMGIGLELQGRRKDGTLFPIEIGLGSINTRAGPLAVAFVTDITERRRLDQALRQSEREVAVLFNNSPDAVARFDSNLRATHVNTAFERRTGISSKDIVGKPIRELPLPPSLLKAMESLFRSVLKTRQPRTAYFSHPTPAGNRKFEERYIPEFAGDESIAAVFFIARDVTEQKNLEDLAAANARDIRALTASLITSQEQERRRLARDIHDSLCQHLGALAAELGDVIADVPASSPGGQRLRTVREHALATAEEARQIARQLHPAILEDLGLPKALQSLCEEFSHQVGIPVKFRLLGQHLHVPIEAASCVYRIAQEAFNNIARHARAKNVTVVLNGCRDLHFSIRDDGVGFNPGTIHGSGGLGLVSMRERARLAHGELTVTSKPGQGTRVNLVLHSPGRAS